MQVVCRVREVQWAARERHGQVGHEVETADRRSRDEREEHVVGVLEGEEPVGPGVQIAGLSVDEALEVGVDHEDEVVELLAPGQGQGAEGLGLVALPIAEEAPDARVPLALVGRTGAWGLELGAGAFCPHSFLAPSP